LYTWADGSTYEG